MFTWILAIAPPDFIKSHFPNIHHQCQRLGIDITQEPIPVVPAAHYTCGGVLVDADARTDLDMLLPSVRLLTVDCTEQIAWRAILFLNVWSTQRESRDNQASTGAQF